MNESPAEGEVQSIENTYLGDATDTGQHSNTTSISEDDFNVTLSSANSDLNLSDDKSGNVPLHTAVLHNDVKTLDYLLRQEDIDLDIQNNDGSTPLHLSILQMQSDSLAMRLIRAGCDINAVNSFEATPLHSAIIVGEMDNVVHELIRRGANINAQDEDNGTPLHYAIVGGDDVEALCMLLYYGADVNMVDKEERTPFTYALFEGQLEPAKVLFDYYDNFDNRDDNGYTALHLVLRFDSSLAIKMIEAGADVNCITNDGYHVLDLALLDVNATTFKSIWSKVDYQSLLQSSFSVLQSLVKCWNHYHACEWIECMYLVLNCPIAHDLMEPCNKYLDRWRNGLHRLDGEFRFLKELLFAFHTLDVEASHRMAIISICLTLGTEVSIFVLDLAIMLFGFADELELLLYMTADIAVELENYSLIMHPLLAIVLAARDFDVEVVFDLCKNLQMICRDELFTEQMYVNVIIDSLGFFSLPLFMKQELLKCCKRSLQISCKICHIPGMQICKIDCLSCCEIANKLNKLPDFPSLQELSRNQAHTFIRQSCQISRPYHFQDAIKNLKVPQIIKDIIRFKMPLYK